MPTTLTEAHFIDRHIRLCMLGGNQKSCKILDAYAAVTNVHARLVDELKEHGIRWPLGPDPVPDGDPDGNPSRFIRVTGADAAGRLKLANDLKMALTKVMTELDKNI